MTEPNWKKVELSPSWDYQTEGIGAELTGILTRIELEVGPNASTLYTIQKPNGDSVAVWGSTVLDARLKNLAIGEEVKIVYLGKAKGQKGKKDYHNFEIYHREIDEIELPTE
jgi:hypothetical protein